MHECGILSGPQTTRVFEILTQFIKKNGSSQFYIKGKQTTKRGSA